MMYGISLGHLGFFTDDKMGKSVSKAFVIVGLVDEAWFKGGGVELVIERKFRNSLAV